MQQAGPIFTKFWNFEMNQEDLDAEKNSKTKIQNTFYDIFSRFYWK